MIKYSGTLEIEGVDFWEWALSQLKTENVFFKSVSFSLTDVEFISEDNNKYLIPIENFWEWITTFLPNPEHDAVFSNHSWDIKSQEIHVSFSVNR